MIVRSQWLPVLPILALITGPPSAAQSALSPDSSDVYPAGNVFPLGLYALQTREQMEFERPAGWSLAHTYYQFGPAYVAMADSAGYRVLANLPGESEALPDDEYVSRIRSLAELDAIGWWDYPEERRYWLPAEMQLVQNLAAWTRQHDPAQRPRYMYLPGHYRARDLAHYVPYLDVVPASVYPVLYDLPHAWTRWRIEETVAAIEEAGATLGADYLAGEKTVVAVVELLDIDSSRAANPEGSYHDFWLSVACGARGVLVSSYAYRAGSPALAASWARLQEAARQISGPEGVGSAFLFGTDVPGVSSRVTAGPPRGPAFVPAPGAPGPISYPAVTVAARRLDEDLYLVAVNSAESTVTAEITGLPLTLGEATLPFEEDTLAMPGGRLELSFAALGVRIVVVRSAFRDLPAEPATTGSLSLEDLRPNPLRLASTATLALIVPAEGRIVADLYDALGRRVAVLLDRTLTAGRHHLDLNMARMATGSYLLRVDGLGGSASRHLTIIE